ncbi:NAD(P)-binding domain [Phytophthora cactorum]|nr:NAD(P)-binding domain [Phytophthora cactorum]
MVPEEPIHSKLQPALGVFALLVALYIIPLASAGYLLRLLVLLYLFLAVLDVLLTRYHRWSFSSSEPNPQAKHVAVVTGASSGLGKEMAYQLADKGYSLLLAARTESVLERMQTEIEQVHNGVKTGINALVAFAAKNGLVVDILVNCAGFSITKDFVKLSQPQVIQIMALNMAAVAQLTHAFVPQMVERGVGRVLNIGSMAGSVVTPSAALYSSVKAFVINFSQGLDYELRGTGVTVTCFCPGPVHTNFGHTADCDDAIYMNIPGTACTPKDCAMLALQAMFRGQAMAYDTWFAQVSAFLGACVPQGVSLLQFVP